MLALVIKFNCEEMEQAYRKYQNINLINVNNLNAIRTENPFVNLARQ